MKEHFYQPSARTQLREIQSALVLPISRQCELAYDAAVKEARRFGLKQVTPNMYFLGLLHQGDITYIFDLNKNPEPISRQEVVDQATRLVGAYYDERVEYYGEIKPAGEMTGLFNAAQGFARENHFAEVFPINTFEAIVKGRKHLRTILRTMDVDPEKLF